MRTKMKTEKAKNFLVGGILVILPLLLVFSFQKALAQTQLTPEEINAQRETKEFTDYILSRPIVKGPFTGKTEADLEEVYPLYISPLSDFNLSWEKDAKQSYAKGESLNLKGTLSYNFAGKEEIAKVKAENCQGREACSVLESPYQMPLFADVGIFVQVWRKDNANRNTGDNLVDEFYVGQGRMLAENEKAPFSLNWKIPAGIREGQYYISFFVNSNQKFNLKGTPLVSFFPAATFNFDVTGEEEKGIAVDKDNIAVNGKQYSYRQPAPGIDLADGKVNIETNLLNLDSKEVVAKVMYELSNWSQEDPEDLIKSSEETKTITANGKEKLNYSLTPVETGSVYNLKITATTANSKSVSNVRFVVNNTSRGIFRFLGLTSQNDKYYPLICLMDAAWKGYFDGKVRLTLAGDNQKTISTWEKEGKVTPDEKCFVVKDNKLVLGKTAGAITLKGEFLNKGGKVTDERTVNYQLGQGVSALGEAVTGQTGQEDDSILWWLVIIIAMLSIAGWSVYYFKNRNNNINTINIKK